ncbi:palmitoyl-protein thioesterase 1 [Rhodnius prolixus]|uniref:Palmitoyl-protein thioesterase 1 n=1 Tax=Rhodnius prolixus TaxID=13249 RepID=R4FKU8_RHOPR
MVRAWLKFSLTMLKVFFVLILLNFTSGFTPVVLWHGMGDSCCNPLSLGRLMKVIKAEMPGVYVKSLRIGKDIIEDTENGYFMNVNLQVLEACKQIKNDTFLQNGYNAIGFSQGAQFLRAVAQRCPSGMKKLISIGGQHQGVYGLPKCLPPKHKLCEYLRYLLDKGAYWSWVQDQFVQAEYWHDPIREEVYRERSYFLADINNERFFNTTYRQGLVSLQKFVMVMFEKDTMVIPKESEWFGFYTPGQAKEITELTSSRIYLDPEDKLGLREMNLGGKLDFISLPTDHLQFHEDWFVDTIIYGYLK